MGTENKDTPGRRSPTFSAPGTRFVEDSFSTDRDGGWWWGEGGDGERQVKLRSLPAAHLLLCGPVPNRPPALGAIPLEEKLSAYTWPTISLSLVFVFVS